MNEGGWRTVIDPSDQQVSDMVLFNKEDLNESISSGKSLDFEDSILRIKDNFLWRNRSRKMRKIKKDTIGRDDFLLAPSSPEAFKIMYNNPATHPSYLYDLHRNLLSYGLH